MPPGPPTGTTARALSATAADAQAGAILPPARAAARRARLDRALPLYWRATWAVVLVQAWLALGSVLTPTLWWYAALLSCTYGTIYLVPAWLATQVLQRWRGRGALPAILGIAWAGGALVQVLLMVDRIVHDLFAFHLNGFVWNLVTTPGGIDSMGGGADSETTFALMSGGWLALQAALLWGAWQLAARDARMHRRMDAPGAAARAVPAATGDHGPRTGAHDDGSDPGAGKQLALARRHQRRTLFLLVAAFVLASVGERFAYGWASLQGRADIHALAHQLPLYQPTTFRRIAERLGIATRRERHLPNASVDDTDGLYYPLQPLRTAAPFGSGAHAAAGNGNAHAASATSSASPASPRQPPNIVLLVCESLRADALTPGLMPNTWAMAQRSLRFTRHYSGGNGTRVGMFTLFYGLYGNLWHHVLAARHPPVLMQRVQALGYELNLQTSARFSYPEFDRTLFVDVPRSAMHEDADGASWQRDRRNMGRFEAWLAKRDRRRPFLFFQFFESPHARYDFPPESVVAKPYLPALNYATFDRVRDMPLIHNRYRNAVHHLDSQLGRVFAALAREGLMANTVVLVTGDHGEEFMEKGNWGHNSFFTEEQVRVPLVLHLPGVAPAVIDRLTSHLDVAPTLLPLLGIANPAADYAHGRSLLDPTPRTFTVFADWNRLGVLAGGFKFTLPTGGGASYTRFPVTTASDAPVRNMDAALAGQEQLLMRVLREASRFQRPPERPMAAAGPR